MKRISKILSGLAALALVMVHSQATAQNEAKYGFLNIVNVATGPKPCKITLMGIDTVPEGLKAGDDTGWFNAPAGTIPLGLKIEGLEDASGSIELAEGQTTVVAIYLEPNPRVDKDGKALPPKIRIKRCGPLAGNDSFYLKLMSFCPGENRFMLGKSPITAKLFQDIEVPDWKGSGFEITTNQKAVGSVRQETDKGQFYLMIGTDHEGRYSTCMVRAEKQELAEWMKPKKPKP